MSTEVVIKDFESNKGLENYLQFYTEGVIEDSFPANHGYNLKVTVSESSHRNQIRKPKFQCSINLSFDGFKKVYTVTKEGSDFYDVVADAGLALKKMLRRRHRLFANHHSYNRSVFLPRGLQAS